MWYTIGVIRVIIKRRKDMKNFKIYAVSGEDSSKYKTFRWKLVHKDSIHAMDGDGIQHYLVDLK